MSAAWGEGVQDEWEPTGPDWFPTGPVTVSDGVSIMLNSETFKQLTHHPVVVAAIEERARQICELANSMAQWSGAEYVVVTQNRKDTTRARCRVKPGNMAAILDDHFNATLLKAAQSVPSDPVGGKG